MRGRLAMILSRSARCHDSSFSTSLHSITSSDTRETRSGLDNGETQEEDLVSLWRD